ncbi:helix-turn-helix domain-containing protein [Dactylosporangium sp. NPDC049525]|uniref:helix-turn-helix domain-containing protein n=1 Tax=Dactylosporangium sp. NPDC049525 TaxID=3154730 RepID=UPI003432D839
MTWVWDFSPVGGTERLVLLAVADNAADDGSNAWPSLATLARKTRVDVRTVRRIIRRLEDGGHLLVEVAAGPGGANRYTVVMTEHAQPVDNPVHGPVDNAPTAPGSLPGGRFARGVQRPGTPDTATPGTPGHSSAPRTSFTSKNRPGAPAPSRAGGAALPPPVDAARCPKHPGQSATHCGPCRAETLGGTK